MTEIKTEMVGARPVRDDRLDDMLVRLRGRGNGRLVLTALSILALAMAIVYTIGGTR
jgi:hypothetical protein